MIKLMDITPPAIYCFGAGYRMKKMLTMAREDFLALPPVAGILVSHKKKDNTDAIEDIPILETSEADVRLPVFIALQEASQAEIRQDLERAGFREIYAWDDATYERYDADFTDAYLKKRNVPCARYGSTGEDAFDEIAGLKTYVVCHHRDKKLTTPIAERKWETEIQAGAALTKERIAQITDDAGDQISSKNPQMNELTALYWIWKNTDWDATGICHYRRRFSDANVWRAVTRDDYDAVLAQPDIVYESVRKQYAAQHDETDFEVMMDAVRERAPAYYDTAIYCADERIFFPFNIFIARRETFDGYCAWIFDIIKEMERRFSDRGKTEIGRYFFSERLTTIYFMKRAKEKKICYATVRLYR